MDKIFLLIVLLVLIIFLATSVLYLKLGIGKGFYHDILGWHKPDGTEGFDGCSRHSICKYCGKNIMQDSQGNWFTACGD